VRKRVAFEGGAWICEEQRVGFLRAKALGDGIVGEAQFEWTARGVVGIAGNEVDEALADPVPGVILSATAEDTGERTGSDLHVAADTDPLEKTIGLGAEDAVAFGMSDDWMKAEELNVVESLVHGRRDGEFVELDEEIVFLVEAILGAVVAAKELEIFVIEVEVGAGGELQAMADFAGKFIASGADTGEIELMIGAAMGRGDDVGDAVGDGFFGHGEGDVDRSGAVIQPWKDVTVKVNHWV